MKMPPALRAFMNYHAQRRRILMVPGLLLGCRFFLGGLLLCRSSTSAVTAAGIATGCSEKYG